METDGSWRKMRSRNRDKGALSLGAWSKTCFSGGMGRKVSVANLPARAMA